MSELMRWPVELEGACYEEAHGWYWPDRQTNGRIRRQPIPAATILDAGLPERPELGDGTTMLVLRSEPFRNLIQRRQP